MIINIKNIGRPKKSYDLISKKVFLERKVWEDLSLLAHKHSKLSSRQVSMASLIRIAVDGLLSTYNSGRSA
tara:strand:- start:6320 stop:6532 length:213 start_codon:yes stop_codon:yes gene_type:complete